MENTILQPGRHHHVVPPRRRVRYLVIACALAAVTLAAIVVGANGSVRSSDLHKEVTAWSAAGIILVFGVLTTRRFARIAGYIIAERASGPAGSAVRMVATIVGYVIVLFAIFGVLDVSITHLLVGGALTGVVLGIAAQQSLGNVFAGIVLLLARPFIVGDHIIVRSGALGGEFDGIVMEISLTYVTILRAQGPIKVPNSGMLAAAVGPYTPPKLS